MPLPNIILIINSTPNSIEWEKILPTVMHQISFIPCFSVSNTITANIYSCLSSSFPSHHKIWDFTDSPGLHVDLITTKLRALQYNTILVGEQGWNSIIQHLNFERYFTAETEILSYLDSKSLKSPQFICIYNPNASYHESVPKFIFNMCKNDSRKIIVCDLTIPLLNFPSNRFPLVSEIVGSGTLFYSSEIASKSRFDTAPIKCSLVDIPVLLFELLNQSIPTSWVGHKRLKSKSKLKPLPFSVLFECVNGDKFYCNHEFKLQFHFGQNRGEIYHYSTDKQEIHDLWDDPQFETIRTSLLLEMIWAQFEKESMPMPRISGA